ncbi:hypothetical protein OBBRIDRAFT_690040, partial [Obba rivulosa]
QILTITADNASSNDVLIEHFADFIFKFPGNANWCRCFAHIINLVIKAILHHFD